MANVAMPFVSIMSKEYAVRWKTGRRRDLNNAPSAPARSSSWPIRRTVIRYQKNADYWGDRAQDRRSGFRHHPRRLGAAAKLKAGECQLMPYPAPADLGAIKADPNLKDGRAGRPERGLSGL